ncbi:MAG: glycine--tRNA ligase subunit beta [Deltaproteobacteria bacterium]|nr:glycine--tRNA ligase subunit beta [Deltaproteobacteria bacterium]
MTKELLLEIGTEEVPAAFMPKALTDMKDMMAKALRENRIEHGEIVTLGTPRRLVIAIRAVAERQQDQAVEKLGPAKAVAFDNLGNPTKAALGFCRGQGIDISEAVYITTDKGEYIGARKKIDGRATIDFFRDFLPVFITAIPFRKSMRWMNFSTRFARPIHWILALFGNDVIPFRIENIESGNKSFGHRFMSPGAFEVASFDDYLTATKKNHVIADPEERRSMILEEARKAAAALGGATLENEALLEEVRFLVEYPSVVCGSFDREYLILPKDVLTTTMIHHQKYFPVVGADGALLPNFITVNNTVARDPSVVARGNEKVVRARLADARFFFDEDKDIPLQNHVDELKNVTFHSLLGTSYEKVMQFRELAVHIADLVDPALKDTVDRTATLAKADLETKMVYEFAELQGIMGREYARIQGEKEQVAEGIYEHYLPTAAGGALPRTHEGAIVGIADKLDTICGCFGVGLIPTGTADPYALRRQALGIINIILDKQYPLNLENLIDKSLSTLSKKLRRPAQAVKADVIDFFTGRLKNQMISQGYSYDTVDAALSTDACDIVRTIQRVKALEAFKNHPDFDPLVIAFKRVVNILKDFPGGTIDSALFENAAEGDLYETFRAVSRKAEKFIDSDAFVEALSEMAQLRKPVDAFFDSVLVMDKDGKVRENRLSLLKEISNLFFRIGDISKIVTE